MKRLKDNSDVPEARLGILPKTYTSSKRTTKLHSARPGRVVLPAASTKELEEREFVVDSGASMHMVSKKDLDSAELDMRTSSSPTTVMTANGEVQTREEATTPAVLSLGEYLWGSYPLQDDSTRDDAETKNDFWHGRFHLSSSRGTQSQTVHAERRIISFSDEVHRRYQNNTYVSWCIVGKTCCGKLFIFPIADGKVKLSGEDQILRTSILIRESPDRGEEREDLRGDWDGSPRPQDPLLGDGESRNDFWYSSGKYIYRHHVEPRGKLFVPREESFLVPLKYINVSRVTRTTLDVMLESCIDDYWKGKGDRDLSDAWTGFTLVESWKFRCQQQCFVKHQ